MASKVGVHINHLTEPDRMQRFIVEARPAIVKALHFDTMFWRRVRALAPDVFVTGRYYVDKQPLDDPEKRAEEHARRILGLTVTKERLITVWEGYNEVNTDDWPNIILQARFDTRMAHILHGEGMEYAAGSYGVGHPTDARPGNPGFTRFVEVKASFAASDYIASHHYFAPRLDDHRDRDAQGVSWWLFRYRIWYPELPRECQKPLLLTEIGIDSGAPHFDPGAQGGWRSFTNAADYVAQLAGFDSQVQQDRCVKAAAIYCWGTLDPTWNSYDIRGEAADRLQQYIVAQTGPVPEGYDSHFVKLPQGATWSLYMVVLPYVQEFRATLGQSHDDAAKIRGRTHAVTFIQPRPGDVEAVKTLSPDARVDIVDGNVYQIEGELKRRVLAGRRFG